MTKRKKKTKKRVIIGIAEAISKLESDVKVNYMMGLQRDAACYAIAIEALKYCQCEGIDITAKPEVCGQ